MDKKGRLNLEQFEKLCAEGVRIEGKDEEVVKAFFNAKEEGKWMKVFKSFDANKNGTIEWDEAWQVFQKIIK